MMLHALLSMSLLLGPAPATPALQWGDCPENATAPGVECATLDVPLDYGDPGGETIEIAISRMKSTDTTKRHGVLLTNSGGPGGPGLAFPAYLRTLGMSQSILDTYDVIGMDPRGVDHSSPVTCDLPSDEFFSNIPPYARNQADVTTDAARARTIAEKCAQSPTARLIPHISTANTARDLDRVRQALGERTASYFAPSYGTYLGSVWATMFPHTTDRVMLDSATGPGGWDATFSRLFGRGVEERFPDFAKWVAAHPSYGLGSTPAAVRAKYLEIAAKLDATPRPEGIDGRLFRQITFADLYYDREFPALATKWQILDTGAPLPAPSDPGLPSTDNYLASQMHVICNDSDWPSSVGHYRRAVEQDRKRWPLFGAAGANITPCAFWPTSAVPVTITDHGPSNILILHNLRDPATPLAGAVQLRKAFGDRARLVTADQGGHLAYLELKNRCADTITETFLTTGKRPAHDVRC
ncbi:alpha/beta hydrolase [Actinoplanes couchii]|uniref:Alpha/beta hydrolase n=1 Tax=Actinoplanes couchii TaxID=403638 RepID=A0ABQ3XNM1_9ACTN|nr:alpha/beta hydrolase [Actinoplanes couchii]MDR6319696.1 pimeloyl-ACP methyl ester carboxylesterase [Actinoplanes couchii]GID60083.1 alpha/beta hydrolase [Actinoplanes couchii]